MRVAPLALTLVAMSLPAAPSQKAKSKAPTPAPASATVPAAKADAAFEALAKRVIEAFLKDNPEAATELGDHRFDDQLSDLSQAGLKRQAAWAKKELKALAAIPQKQLSEANAADYDILRDQLEGLVFEVEDLKSWQWNPMNYNPGEAIHSLLAREFAPLPDRLKRAKARLELLPEQLKAGKANLHNPPKIYTETALQQLQGTINMIREGELKEAMDQAPALKAELAPAQAKALAALEDFAKWMKEDLLPRSKGDFRIGEAAFRKKLRYTLNSDLSAEEILKRAEAELKTTQARMAEVAAPLFKAWFPDRLEANPKAVVKAVLDKIAEKHPTNETIVDLANQDLKAATDFVRAKGLVTVPEAPVKIIVLPEFQRGVAVAYCQAPGPLEPNGTTFYAISPTPADWDAKRVASFFREYNDAMVVNLTVHEAMPGHYLQLAHSNLFKAPTMVRGIFTSGLFAEGWAVYTEKLMAEAGFGGPEVHMQQLKMRLRVIINAILDQKLHTQGMTEQQALKLMMEEGFQEEGEAVGKWRRACLSSTQLSTYFVGASEMDDIRRAAEAKAGKDFDVKRFHDTLLSFGTPAPKYARRLMGL